MSYFTAVVSRREDSWRSHDLAVDEFSDLSELTWAVRSVAWNPSESLVILEHVGDWFAVINTSDESPRAFVSDTAAAARGPYAALLGATQPATYVREVETLDPVKNLVTSAAEVVVELHSPCHVELQPAEWGGDLTALESFGIAAETVQAVLALHAGHPIRMVAEIYELLGLSEIADGVR